jgi:hypothetical protein
VPPLQRVKGITAEDLAWQQHYRAQGAAKATRRAALKAMVTS